MSPFDHFLPLAGVLAGLLFFVALVLLWNDPSSETGPAGRLPIGRTTGASIRSVALLVAPLSPSCFSSSEPGCGEGSRRATASRPRFGRIRGALLPR